LKKVPNESTNPSGVVYLVGIFLLGTCYYQVKEALGGGVLFVIAAIIYLAVLRLIGDFVAKKWHGRKST